MKMPRTPPKLLSPADLGMERAMKLLDDCLQLHGGYGYMTEYPISQMWVDQRVQKIYAGSNEIMKEIISRTL